jgi:hypothetical protein
MAQSSFVHIRGDVSLPPSGRAPSRIHSECISLTPLRVRLKNARLRLTRRNEIHHVRARKYCMLQESKYCLGFCDVLRKGANKFPWRITEWTYWIVVAVDSQPISEIHHYPTDCSAGRLYSWRLLLRLNRLVLTVEVVP